MGLDYKTKKDYQGWYKDSSFTDRICSFDGLKYHSDWNFLMQVVEKIFKGFYKLNPCPIYLKMNIEKQLIATDKEGIYNACVEFIKWYNQQNQ